MNEREAILNRPQGVLDAGPHPRVGGRMVRLAGLPVAGVGGLLSLLALVFSPQLFGFSWLVGFGLIWAVCVGALFLIAMHHITGAIWSVVVRRSAEALVSAMPVLILFFVPVVLMSGWIFEWTHEDVMASDPILSGKSAYLNLPFFILRAAAFLSIWGIFGWYFVRRSLKQDDGSEGPEVTHGMRRTSAPFAILFALSVTFAAFDWYMSVQPHFFSTIFGVYMFAGLAVSGQAGVVLVVLWLRRKGCLVDKTAAFGQIIDDARLYHMGTLLFAFSCFWGYIAMSQFLLIWYANLPEEGFWFVDRWKDGWAWISVLLMFTRFVFPFLILLSRKAKSSTTTLAAVSILALFGQVVDLYWLVMPEAPENTSVFIWQVIGPLLLAVGLVLIAVGRFVSRHSAIPVGDPLLEESRMYHA
ncbi:quinol:cytochrome C oxidoreductase [bacterium]|nr:quinol:cytochrome C oxidoreductase [bacterium]